MREVSEDVVSSIIANSAFCLSGANRLCIEDFIMNDRRLFTRIVVSRQHVPSNYISETRIEDLTVRKQVFQRFDFLRPIANNRLTVDIIPEAILSRLELPKEVTSIDLAPHDFDPLWSVTEGSWCSASLHLFHNPGVEVGDRSLPNGMESYDEHLGTSFSALQSEFKIDLQKLKPLGPGIALVLLKDIAAVSSWRVFKTQEQTEGLRAAIKYSDMIGATPEDLRITCQLRSLEGDVFFEDTRVIEDTSIRMIEFAPTRDQAKEIAQASVRLYLGDMLLDDSSGYVLRTINLSVSPE